MLHSKLRKGSLLLTTLAAPLFVGTLLAASAHFQSLTSSVDRDGDLTVTFKEAGLGNNPAVSHILTANATATYVCVNHGGNIPNNAAFQEVSSHVSTGSSTQVKNGKVSGAIIGEAPPTTLSCPGKLVPALAQVSYWNVILTDITNGITAYPTDVSRAMLE